MEQGKIRKAFGEAAAFNNLLINTVLRMHVGSLAFGADRGTGSPGLNLLSNVYLLKR